MVAILAKVKSLALMAVVVVGAVGSALMLRQPAGESLVLEPLPASPTATAGPTATPAPIVVFVSGAVREPGVYTLPPGSRVVDAIAAAGGATGDAAFASLNQATLLGDGVQVHMPEEGELPLPVEVGGGGAPFGTPAPATGALVRLNSADAPTLEGLPGIGPALAARIIDYRSRHGPFTSLDQLKEVSGIGDKLLDKIRDHVILE